MATPSDVARLPDLEKIEDLYDDDEIIDVEDSELENDSQEDALETRMKAALARAARELSGQPTEPRLSVPPEDEDLSDEERESILRSVGIDPKAAADNPGTASSSHTRVWRCVRCEATGGSGDVSYVKGELLCKGCAEAAAVERRAEDDGTRKRAALEVSTRDPQAAAIRASLYGSLFFVGVAGPLWIVGDLLGLGLLLGAAVAGFGGWQVYRASVA